MIIRIQYLITVIFYLDIFKAFDTVKHTSLLDLLDFFGFGQYFKRAIQTLYSEYNSSVKFPWGTACRLDISLGIKEGDPVAPFLFLLVMQTLEKVKLNAVNFLMILLFF